MELNNKEIFRELLAYEIANILGLNHVSYEPYVLNGKNGIISPNFVKDGHKYITGCDLLSYYFEKTRLVNKEYLYDKKDNIYGIFEFKVGQDLYVVWQAMEDKFKNYPGYTEQIQKFMDDLINMILFYLLIADYDFRSVNWVIEYDDTSFKLCPIFDNNLAFTNLSSSAFNTVQGDIPSDESLKLLINESDEFIYNKYANFSNLINPDNIANIIDNTIKKYNYPISEELRKSIINNFTKNHRSLEEVINSQIKEESNSPTIK